nr:GntR family transcriptional regulator [Acuticoccus kandeliae]
MPRAKSTKSGSGTNSSSLSLAAYELIRAQIQDGRVGPGDRVMEDEIARQLNASRTPVRDAMRRLEAEGFLVHESHRGMVIPRLDHQMIMELYEMWIVLEAEAARLVARHASDAEVEMLDELVKASRVEVKTSEDMANHNRRFHKALYNATHNRYLLKSVGVLMDSLNILSHTTFTIDDRLTRAQDEHQAIVDAIRTRDVDAAAAASRAHTEASFRARLKLLARMES